MHNWKSHLFTITGDKGREFAMHQEIVIGLEVDFYFAYPDRQWERGANENLNELTKKYILKSASFEEINNEIIIEIQGKLDNNPRKRFNFERPKYISNQKVAIVT